eukprot:30294-Pelagococcus_subviridis.AAC.42
MLSTFSVNSLKSGSSHAASNACSAFIAASIRMTVFTTRSSPSADRISSLVAMEIRCFLRSRAPSSSSASSSSNGRFGRGSEAVTG